MVLVCGAVTEYMLALTREITCNPDTGDKLLALNGALIRGITCGADTGDYMKC